MKFMKLFLIILLMSTWNMFATDIHGGKDRFEKRYILDAAKSPDLKVQKNLRSSEAWKSFSLNFGNWYVQFDERSGMPHRASGKPIAVAGANATDAAYAFIQNQLSSFKVPVNDLHFQTENFSGKYFNVFYTQKYLGLDVLNSRVFIKLLPDLKVSTFGLDIFTIDGLSVIPTLSESQITGKAQNDFDIEIQKVTQPVLKVLPFPAEGMYEFRLVYELTVVTKDEHDVPGQYYSLLDAHSGELIYRQNRVKFSHPLNSDINVTATVSMYSPYDPPVVKALPNLKVDFGSIIQYTDSSGNVNIAGAGSVTGTFTLAGLWSKVFTDGGTVSPETSGMFNPGSSVMSFDSVTTISHTSGYYHVNIIHDFMKSFFPSFPSLDMPLPTQIDRTSSSCNAYYNGSSINFYAAGNGCNSMAQIGDIVYHEYGHGINDKFYQWQGASWDNGGMHEGYADVWGFSITQSPVLGTGYRSSTSYIRRYDSNRKVYPQHLTGEVHDDGEIIAGAWYDVSLNFGSWSAMTELFASTYFDLVTGPDGTEGQIYTDILLSALNHDDNDGDLSNGTPNDLAILDAFELHGITLLNSVDIQHSEILIAGRLAPIVIDATMAAQYPWYTLDVRLNYRTSAGAYTQIPMTSSGLGTFTASIPGQASGTVISYFLESVDGSGVTLSTNPEEAIGTDINIPYFILVDLQRQVIEDFDSNQSAGWLTSLPTDNASSGFWIIDAPVPSYESNGTLCQTDHQHTPGGIQCAITGNALSSTSSVGNNDVDGGKTTLQSPMLDISMYSSPVISYWRWFTNDQGSAPKTDFWRTYISDDGVNFLAVENLKIPDHRWRRFALKVHDYFPGATQVMMRFVADDANNGSIVELAVDDIEILDIESNVSVGDLSNEIVAGLYPNPAGSLVSLDFISNSAMEGSIEVIGALGQLVYSQSAKWLKGKNQISIDTQNFSNGIYHVVIRSESTRTILPLSVLHH
ncbi:MAG TPA: T9SS type A sorting domain-containing protein [Bacteroidia bacterium]|nr:T9SS type A sorting domain-containing protein [Bacteroidia bacterium]